MSFLVLILVLVVEKFSALRHRLQHDGPWLAWLSRCQQGGWLPAAPWTCLLAAVLLPVLAVGLLLRLLEPFAYGWLVLPVHLVVVLYSLGRGHPRHQLGGFRDAWRRGDTEAAALVAQRDLALEAPTERALLERVQDHLLWQSFQGFFTVIFWYVLLGPLAPLAYRLLALAAEHGGSEAVRERAAQLRHAFDWLPVRLLALTFALVGHFSGVLQRLLPELLHWELPAARLLASTGPAAADLHGDEIATERGIARLDALWALLVRSAMFWYAALALWTIVR
ncbi:regulatory signaling modulator protein AmpE [Stutzerimonas azotifigens]|uniref:regulatory signaling modulator protein AmpE n=1 Tax=Stutzerimonas azotifigens TaxID=291995 RepID=UPI0004046360|nr:regulatory signaling modulator protein AmpE [Stutzerimonas azotifigens]